MVMHMTTARKRAVSFFFIMITPFLFVFNGGQLRLAAAAARGLAVGGYGDGGLGYAVDHGHHHQVIGAAKGRLGTKRFGKENARRRSLFGWLESCIVHGQAQICAQKKEQHECRDQNTLGSMMNGCHPDGIPQAI